MSKPRTAVCLLTRVTYMNGDTVYFTTEGLGAKPGNSRHNIIKPEHVPLFEGQEGWFEMQRVSAKPWPYWRAIRQLPAPG